MDWLKLPSLNGLRAFAAVAETGSYTRAAQKLNVTHAAISQQVKALEDRMGLPLVARSGRGIVLTEEGQALARDLELGFATIERGVERLTETAANRPVQVTMSPAFAVEWLLPRIPAFQQANPDITLLLNPTADVVDLKPGGIDVAIRYRDKRRPVSGVEPLLMSDMIMIAAPELVAGKDVSTPTAMTGLPWLQELGTNEAAEWLTYHGVIPNRPLTIHQMPGNLIMNSVRRGDGITFTSRAFFQTDIDAGRIVELFSEKLFGIYYIETRQGVLRPAVRTFVNWLKSQAETVTI
ncbi:MAG: LysR family transcriptional regulator [Ruegeria sp.]